MRFRLIDRKLSFQAILSLISGEVQVKMSHYQLTFFIGISNGIKQKTSKKQILKRCEGKKYKIMMYGFTR